MLNPTELVGKTVLLKGYRGDGDVRVGTVVAIRDTHEKLIGFRTRFTKPITRGRWLVTMFDTERKEVRSYYVAHIEDMKVIGWFRRMVRWLAVEYGFSEIKA